MPSLESWMAALGIVGGAALIVAILIAWSHLALRKGWPIWVAMMPTVFVTVVGLAFAVELSGVLP